MTDRLTLHPFVSIVPQYDGDEPAEFVVRDYADNRYLSFPNVEALRLFELAVGGIDRPDLVAAAVEELGLDRQLADDIVGRLESLGVLLPPDDEAFEVAAVGESWADSGMSVAFDFYRCIRDYPYHEMESPEHELERVEERREQRGEPPDIYTTFPDAPTVDLPSVDETEPLASLRDAWHGRVSCTRLDRERLSRVLYYVFGEIGRQPVPGLGEFVLKTSPSGGGRHPTELYLHVFDVEGVEPGAYHYSVRDHTLERLAGGSESMESQYRVDGEQPAVGLLAAARVERLMWKYRDPRSFRVPHHDVGHLFETLRLVSRATGVVARFQPPADPATLAAEFDIDRLVEPLFGTATLSTDE